MTQDEIIELAKQAGLHFYEFGWTSPTKENLYPENVSEEALEAFAKLVAAKEREACAEICDESMKWHKGRLNTLQAQIAATCASSIRARGEA